MNKPEVLIIDDEPQIQKLLQINLENNDFKVVQAVNAKEGLMFAAAHPPDLILLDLGLPDQSGHEVLKALREWYQKPVIILSVKDEEDDIVMALDTGASDYITKPFRSRELLARIRSALRRSENVNAENKLIFGDLEIDLAFRIVRKDDEVLKLTSTEYQLLSLFVKHEGRVLTHRFILNEIWGHSYQLETQYLRVFVASLRKKIEADPTNPQHILTENRVGYRFV